MAIDMVKAGVSAGVGVVDEVLEWWDEKSGRTESFRTATDIGRLAIAGLGYAIQIFWPRQSRLGEAMALSATPLLVKSIAKPVREAMGATAGASRTYVPRRRAPVPASLPAMPVAGAETVSPARNREEETVSIISP